jgi:endonuclease/exonuclease/phosphatase (EEP) superfamily protein YafD
VNRRDRTDLVGQLSAERQADVVVLAESAVDRRATLDRLRRSVAESFDEPETETARLHLFARRAGLDLREVYGDALGRVTIRVLRFQKTEFLFVAVHLPSKRDWSSEDQLSETIVLADQIRRLEARRGHQRTIVVGDLNMNPFEAGVVQASGLHAMMDRATLQAGSRIVQGKEYPFFYNPMWGFFGDRSPGPPGTFHYRHSGHLSYDWNMFDQVLGRPGVLPWFSRDIEIVTEIGESLLTRPDGRPNAEVGSDHFPIVFRLVARD